MRVDAIVTSTCPLGVKRSILRSKIYKAAGPRLYRASKALRGIPIGSVRLTLGYGLPARYILHANTPIAHTPDPTDEEKELLARCSRSCLALASQRKFHTLVFPVLGTGKRGFPFKLAATIALTTIQQYLEQDTILDQVIVTIYDDRGYDLSNLAKELLGYYMDEGWLLNNDWDNPLR
jgi:O-acetyl-ADP-ribose deacetylase (regulator of RNase III)